jgi:threonine aldolase
MSARLSEGLARSNESRLDWCSTANEVFPVIAGEKIAELRAAGAVFHSWEAAGDGCERIRLVTSFLTTPADVDAFLALMGVGARS